MSLKLYKTGEKAHRAFIGGRAYEIRKTGDKRWAVFFVNPRSQFGHESLVFEKEFATKQECSDYLEETKTPLAMH